MLKKGTRVELVVWHEEVIDGRLDMWHEWVSDDGRYYIDDVRANGSYRVHHDLGRGCFEEFTVYDCEVRAYNR